MGHPPLIWFIVLLCSIPLYATATVIHRWVDDDGVTHFSDAPPTGGDADVATIELDDDFSTVADANADYYSIANQWKRMREERDAKDRLNLEKARIRVDESAAAVYTEPSPGDETYYGGYPLYGLPYGSGYGHSRRPRATHRDERPKPADRRRYHVKAGAGHIAGGAGRPPKPSNPIIRPGGGHRPAGHGGASRGGTSFNLR
jgi:Domain of unknown function (DUF4124)